MRDWSLESVWLRSLSGVSALAAARALDPARLFKGTQPIDRDAPPQQRLPLPDTVRLFENLEALVKDEPGLRAAEQLTPQSLDLHHYAGAALGTVGAALDSFAATVRLISTAASASLDRTGAGRVELTLSPMTMEGLPRALHDYFVLAVVRGFRRVCAQPLPLEAVALAGPQSGKLEAYARAFGAPVRFGVAQSTLTFAAQVDAMETIAPDPKLAALLGTFAGELLASLPEHASLGDQLRAMVVARLPDGEPSIAWAARRLAVSSRTLQRRLTEAGLPAFSAFVDDTRKAQAERLLRQTDRKLSDVATELGYADLRGLHRACHRWFGCSPSAFRAR